MKTALITLGLLLGAGTILGQEHAPTLDVCKADIAVWYDRDAATDYLNQESKHMTDGIRNTNPYNKLTITEIILRIHEMGQCYSVSGFEDRYHDAQMFYSGIMHDRMANFIYRHHLMEQLKKEDAEGIR